MIGTSAKLCFVRGDSLVAEGGGMYCGSGWQWLAVLVAAGFGLDDVTDPEE